MNLEQERILITGGHGFLGRHLQAEFDRRGIWRDRLLLPQHKDYDLISADDVARMYQDMRPTVVIHLAAEVGGIGANRLNPGRFFYANMMMGLNLIEGARIGRVKKFLQIGTVCAYPSRTPIPFREEMLWSGYPEKTNAPYGVAKRTLLTMLQAYKKQYDLTGAYLLLANLYGKGDNFDLQTSHVIPAMIVKFCKAKDAGEHAVTLWGTGNVSREFLYARDAARAIVMAAERYSASAPLNIGTGLEVPIWRLAHTIRDLVGFGGRIRWDSTKPNGQQRRCLDISRARSDLGFVAQTSLNDGLKETIRWYRENHGNAQAD